VHVPPLEELIVEAVARSLESVGFRVFKHVKIDDVEMDIVALEPGEQRPLVTIVEVKRKPKIKLLKQLRNRAEMADYVYAAVPYMYYSWALEKVDPRVGIMLYFSPERVEVFRRARYLGKGVRSLKLLELLASGTSIFNA